jgi:hypothetical protein
MLVTHPAPWDGRKIRNRNRRATGSNVGGAPKSLRDINYIGADQVRELRWGLPLSLLSRTERDGGFASDSICLRHSLSGAGEIYLNSRCNAGDLIMSKPILTPIL